MKPLLAATFAAAALAVSAQEPAVFPAKMSQVYRVRVDKGANLLETIVSVIQKHGIRDGAVLTAVGAVGACTFHGVGGAKQTVTEEMEINHLGGVIADGEPHLHVVLTTAKRGAFGGHLEEGCRVSNRVELTIAQFAGEPLGRSQGALGKKTAK
jgi:predicted DNA-binding protein with PD1-like motif